MRKLIISVALIAVVFLFSMVDMVSATPLEDNGPFFDMQGAGLSIAEAGAGLTIPNDEESSTTFPPTDITIDIGGEVEAAYLYWAGRDYFCQQDAGDNCILTSADQELIFDGSPITGVLVGTEENKASGNRRSNNIGYRANVTNEVRAKAPGVGLAFTVEDNDTSSNLTVLNGAGLLVIYTDESDTSVYRVMVFDGLDFAYGVTSQFPEAQVTDPVIFQHGPSTDPRTAEVIVFVGDAQAGRPDRIDITDAFAGVTQINNELVSADLFSWDTLRRDVTVPPGGGTTKVQLFSEPPDGNPDSLLWVVGALRIPIPGNPDIDIRKQAEGPDIRTVESGSDVTFEIVVTNTGDVDLTNVEVTDAQVPGCATFIGDLAAGSSFSYECTAPNVSVSFENVACVMGEANGTTVEDCDPSTVEVAQIHIEKLIRGEDVPTGDSVCADFGKPKILTLVYTGLGPLNISNTQEGKVNVEGDPAFAAPVRIIASDKENLSDSKVKIWFDGTVTLGDSFVISAMFGGLTENKLKADTRVFVFDPGADPLADDPLQLVKFHTSCSKELLLGDEFGSVQLIAFVDENGDGGSLPDGNGSGFGDDADLPTGPEFTVGATVIWTYVVTNIGDEELSNIAVTDSVPGVNPVAIMDGAFNVGDADMDNNLDVDEEWLFEAMGTVVEGQYVNIGKVIGESPSNQMVMDDDPNHHFGLLPPPADVCADFGKPKILTMIYTGLGPLNISNTQEGKVNVEGDPAFAAPVRIIAADKDNLNDSKVKIWSDEIVNAVGGSFVISAMFGGLTESKLKADTRVFVFQAGANVLNDDPLQLVKFHTSCSKELFLGDEFGSIQLVGFVDENGQGP